MEESYRKWIPFDRSFRWGEIESVQEGECAFVVIIREEETGERAQFVFEGSIRAYRLTNRRCFAILSLVAEEGWGCFTVELSRYLAELCRQSEGFMDPAWFTHSFFVSDTIVLDVMAGEAPCVELFEVWEHPL